MTENAIRVPQQGNSSLYIYIDEIKFESQFRYITEQFGLGYMGH